MRFRALTLLLTTAAALLSFSHSARALDYDDYPIVKLRTLDKITARTMTFEAKVGATMKFGEIFIKVQTCRKPPPVQKTEASAFLQIWETDTVKDQSRWIFSGWMFASSPTLSAMDHPVYDVWVIDCLGKDDPEALPPPPVTAEGDGTILPPGTQPPMPTTEQLGEHGESAPVPETPATSETPAPDAVTTDADESVPTSNMPQDAVPTAQPEPTPQEPVTDETPQAYPEPTPQAEPQPEPQPVAPAPDETGGGSEGFQGIY